MTDLAAATPRHAVGPSRRSLATRMIGGIATVLAAVAAVPVLFWAGAMFREAQSRVEAAPPGGRFVTGGDLDIFIQEAGPAVGPPVLLIHGTGAWSEIWRETTDALAGGGHRVIALDLPPFGFSERPAAADYSDQAQAARILGVMDALGLPAVTLVGHSFGGRPTAEVALGNPARVRSLILVDAALTPGLSGGSPARLPLLARAALSTPLIRDPLVASTVTNPLLTRWLLRQLILDPEDATDARVRMLQQQSAVEGTTHALGLWLREFLTHHGPSLNSDPARYATLTMPTLLVWGAEDQITPLARGQHLLSLLPAGEMAVLDRTGHIPAIEDPSAFNRALLAFLAPGDSPP